MTNVPLSREVQQGPVKLFQIYNTSHRSLLVLAPNASTATDMAYAANHLHYVIPRKDRSYPNVSEVRKPLDDKLASCWAAIEAAITRGILGTVHIMDGCIFVGGEEITPPNISSP